VPSALETLLIADIGGTNARFGLASQGHTIEHVRTLPVAEHAGLAQAAASYLASVPHGSAPRRAAMAVATAVRDDVVKLTNSPWSFSQRELARALGLEQLVVLNDFEALALSLPHLGPHQLRTRVGMPTAHGTLAVVGAGTGLGVGAAVQGRDGRWVALPGEGGHATLAPTDDFESELLRLARREHTHVSAERLLSGMGLPLLHRAVGEALGAPVDSAGELSAEAIVSRALDSSDAVCVRTVEVFCAMLGSFTGSVALTLGATAVYIGGGIVPRLGDAFDNSAFRPRFEAKGRFRAHLQRVPTAVITDTLAALVGARAALG
jgi:glucokinase